jgi:hypothetical protein
MRRIALTGACLLGLGIAGYLWFFGAGWTVSGAPLLANILLAHISRIGHIEPILQIALPLSGRVFAALWALPVIFSLDEAFGVPLQKAGKRWEWLGLGLAIVWLCVVGSDLSSTFLGLYNPSEPVGTLAWLLRGNVIGASVNAVFFTFFPEWLAGAMLVALTTIWSGGPHAGTGDVDAGGRDAARDRAGDRGGRDQGDRDSARA